MRNCSIEAVTVLRELGGADQGGDLEGVLADGAVAQVLGVFPAGGVALLLQLHLCRGKVQVQRRVLQLLCFCLVFQKKTRKINICCLCSE